MPKFHSVAMTMPEAVRFAGLICKHGILRSQKKGNRCCIVLVEDNNASAYQEIVKVFKHPQVLHRQDVHSVATDMKVRYRAARNKRSADRLNEYLTVIDAYFGDIFKPQLEKPKAQSEHKTEAKTVVMKQETMEKPKEEMSTQEDIFLNHVRSFLLQLTPCLRGQFEAAVLSWLIDYQYYAQALATSSLTQSLIQSTVNLGNTEVQVSKVTSTTDHDDDSSHFIVDVGDEAAQAAKILMDNFCSQNNVNNDEGEVN